jgi:hypothetical protein
MLIRLLLVNADSLVQAKADIEICLDLIKACCAELAKIGAVNIEGKAQAEIVACVAALITVRLFIRPLTVYFLILYIYIAFRQGLPPTHDQIRCLCRCRNNCGNRSCSEAVVIHTWGLCQWNRCSCSQGVSN